MALINFIKHRLRWAYGPVIDCIRYQCKNVHEKNLLKNFELLQPGRNRVFYFGITIHPNLGDLAQRYCITEWIRENYPDYELVMMESNVIVNPLFTEKFFYHLKNIYGEKDVIIFQSGYCTQDLGGNHPLMHRLVCDHMSNAHILMMPQTIFFKKLENKRICSENHNNAKNMLFLARDFTSYEMAKEMFPDIHVKAYPDIVTTMIGTMIFKNRRDGICICTRNDGEKLYSSEEIAFLIKRFENDNIFIKHKDTQATQSMSRLIGNLKYYIDGEIESYSYFKVTITDRYHGTIFSLCAGTPVIVIKTTDHKVITGAEWFKGVYDDYVYVADDLNDAYNLGKRILQNHLNYQLSPYFKERYYNKLKDLFESGEDK